MSKPDKANSGINRNARAKNRKKSSKVASGLSSKDIKIIADQIYGTADCNRPYLSKTKNGVIDILRGEKPEISTSSAFIGKVKL